ncbi:hypothetical protein [Zavarzinia sp. CC-PAN008]|uniref:hypothetical protein n=1 Tax=Zavarzinia sp. CC-PAN008 TaxID=3243332 RepID=UPI003F7430C2
MTDLLRILFRREPPARPDLWHRWEPLFPVLLANGWPSLPIGRIWRRRTARGWEYQQDRLRDVVADLVAGFRT